MFGLAALVNGVGVPSIGMLQSGSSTLAAIALTLSAGVLWAPMYGPEAALFCGSIETRARYTGGTLVYQVGALMFLGPMPILAARNGSRPWWPATFIVFACVGNVLSRAAMRRTFAVPAPATGPAA